MADTLGKRPADRDEGALVESKRPRTDGELVVSQKRLGIKQASCRWQLGRGLRVCPACVSGERQDYRRR